MTTVDKLLVKIINHSEPTPEEVFSPKDARVLRSLATAVATPNFITENQSRLLLKILTENQEKITISDEDVKATLALPTWTKPFRPIDKTKKLFMGRDTNDDLCIVVEYAFSANIRKCIGNLAKKIDGNITSANSRHQYIDLTENNIVTLVDALHPFGFEVDTLLETHYKTIKSWSENEVKNQFLLTSITNQNFQKHITNELGIHTAIDQNIINDRSIRYQYFTEKTEKNPENLTEIIASRKTTKVWVDSKQYSMNDVINSLIELKRLPVLFVFDGFAPSSQASQLQEIALILDNLGIDDNVGIYFRLPNNEDGKIFNTIISERKYNCKLDKDTKVVGVQSGKIPKFFINNEWKPMSVVSIKNTLRHNKTAIYANCCDLVISYTEKDPIIEARNIWQ